MSTRIDSRQIEGHKVCLPFFVCGSSLAKMLANNGMLDIISKPVIENINRN